MAAELPKAPAPTLIQRARELASLRWPGAQVQLRSGKELRYLFQLRPGNFGDLYSCLMKLNPDGKRPDVIVLKPDLAQMAEGRELPHIYPYKGSGTRLCLWWPRGREWVPQMTLHDTFIPWTAEWLRFFEDWLFTGEWAGGGQHPQPKRWGPEGRPRLVESAA